MPFLFMASESLTLADLSPKHAHCAVLHTASRPPAAASGAVASAENGSEPVATAQP